MSTTDLSSIDLNTSQISEWRSIVTLIVFVTTNLAVIFEFHLPFYIPQKIWLATLRFLNHLRVISARHLQSTDTKSSVKLRFPVNYVTAPLIADLFLLAISAIHSQEVYDGTIGANNIKPYNVMLFFFSLAYIAISIDASGLIRYLAYRVLKWGGKFGHRLFFYLYLFFFILTACIGNDPVILSGTAFLAYMTRVSSNIYHPRAWIYTEFAVANIASAILVSSNPTNLVLSGAFNILFIDYTANIIVPVLATGIVLFPFLLYFVFADEKLIPLSIVMHELPSERENLAPKNPNIPHARGLAEEEENAGGGHAQGELLSLEEILNPFLDKRGAIFGGVIMATTLITLLAINSASARIHEQPVFYITVPAAVVTLCYDLACGWHGRKETREIARAGRDEVERARAEKALEEEEKKQNARLSALNVQTEHNTTESSGIELKETFTSAYPANTGSGATSRGSDIAAAEAVDAILSIGLEEKRRKDHVDRIGRIREAQHERGPATVESFMADAKQWFQETFPTAATVLSHLPYALLPFAFCMFVLVQGLVTKGWVTVLAYGYDHWVNATGTVGAVGGMGFLSVILCNFAGTNIGTTILLSRVVQAWQAIHQKNGLPISDRTFWGTVYSMALGVNYGAFSMTFSASLAGLLWRDILRRKNIHVRSLDFLRVNLPMAIAMTVGCVVLIGEIYIFRHTTPYDA